MKKICYFLICFFISLLCVYCSDNNETEIDPVEYQKPLPVDNNIVAHRGAFKVNNTPHNSRAAFRDAIEMQLYAIETDIHITADEKVVVFHDNVFHGLDIDKSTYAELNAAGKLENGEDLPLFEEFVKMALDSKHTKIFFDVKLHANEYGGREATARACVKAIEIAREMKAHHFVEFLITNEFVIQRAQVASVGDFALAYQSSDEPNTYPRRGYDWANQPASNFYPDNPERITEFKELGMRVSAYMADNVESAKWFLEHKIDQIMTNDPEMVLKAQRGEL